MNKQMLIADMDSTPLPLIVANKWNFKLNYHEVDGELLYAVEDWIAGLISEDNRLRVQNIWKKAKNKVQLSVHHLNHLGTDGKKYKKDHTDDHGLYLIAQNLRVTKNRPALREIKGYLAKAGVFVDRLRTNKDGARDKLRGELNAEKPDAAMEEAIEGYRKQRRSDSWINSS